MNGLSYELALELKNAGFPQTGEPVFTGFNVLPNPLATREAQEAAFKEGNFAYIPTLEELIESCGDDFETLVRYGDGTWRAYRREGSEDLQDVPYRTPLEAVARLWLALNLH